MGAPAEIHVGAFEAQRPGLRQRRLDADPDHPAELRRAVPKGIVGIEAPRRGVPFGIEAAVEVAHRVVDPGGCQPGGGEDRRRPQSLLEPRARRRDPSELRCHALVPAPGVEAIRLPPQVAERAVELEAQGQAPDRETLPDQGAAAESGVAVLDARAGYAPVRKAVDVDDPTHSSAGAGKEPRVDALPAESGVLASGVRGAGGREQGQDGQRRRRRPPEAPPHAAAPGGGARAGFRARGEAPSGRRLPRVEQGRRGHVSPPWNAGNPLPIRRGRNRTPAGRDLPRLVEDLGDRKPTIPRKRRQGQAALAPGPFALHQGAGRGGLASGVHERHSRRDPSPSGFA